MKKAIVLILALVMCMGVAACGGGGDDPATTSGAPETSAPATSAPAESAAPETSAPAASAPATDAPTTSTGGSKLEAIKAAGEIVMVTSPDFAPYEFIDPTKDGDERYVGLDLSLGRYIAEELGVDLKINTMDFDATLAAIGTSNCDMGISGYSPSEERKASMDFSAVYYEGDQVIVIRKEDADKYKEAKDLAGLKVAAQNGSEQQAIVEGQLEGSELQRFTKVPEEILALQSKTVEAVALEGPNAEQIVAANDDLMVSEIKVEGSTAGTAVAVPKGSEDLLAEIDRIIQKAKDEGKIQQWLEEAVEINQGLSE